MADRKMMNSRMGCGCGMGNGSSRMKSGYSNMTRSGNTRYMGDCGCKTQNTANTVRETANTSCCDAMETLRKIEFAIVDVSLYLNAYPESECALAYYHKLIEERKCLLHKIHEECGPTTLYDNVSETCWKWTEGPWPWHFEAN